MNYKNPSQTGKGAIAAQFSPTPIQFHRHTGQDSPQVDYNSLLNKPTTLSIFAGLINSDGSVVSLPAGWTSTKTGTGGYEIGHTLGTADYVVVVSFASSFGSIIGINSQTSSKFVVVCTDISNSFKDAKFGFILTLTN